MNSPFQPEDRTLLDQVGGMLLVEWRDGIVKPPAGVAYGTHLLSLLVCPTGGELKAMHLAWAYRDASGRVFRTGKEFEGINALWFFKCETLKKFSYEPLRRSDILFLQLDELQQRLLESVHPNQVEKVIHLRKLRELDPFRNPSFPDDVQVSAGPDTGLSGGGIEILGEQVWVRLRGMGPEGTYTGELLNQPLNHPFQKGQQVQVRQIGTSSNPLLCIVQTPPVWQTPQRPDFVAFVRGMYRDFFDIHSPDSFRRMLPEDAESVPASPTPGQPFGAMLPSMEEHKYDFEFAGNHPGMVECSFDKRCGKLLMLRIAIYFQNEDERREYYQKLKTDFVDQIDVEGVQHHPFTPVEALFTERLVVGVNHHNPEPFLSVWLAVRDEYIQILVGNN